MFLCFVPGRGSSRPWAWWGWLDGWAHLWAISAPLAVPAPSTRASGLGAAAWPGRRRPGCATGRAEMGRTVHHPSSDQKEKNRFPSWYGARPSARPGKQLLTAQNSGADSTRRGKAPPLAILFPHFSSLRKRPKRSASPLPDWQFCARFTIKSETIQKFCIVSLFIYLAARRSSRYAPQSATRANTLPGLRCSRAWVTPSCQAADRQVTPTWSQESTSVAASPI